MAKPAPKAELMAALGRLVRGLSALFWGLPLALVLGVQTARTEWLRPFGVLPMLGATLLLWYGGRQLCAFQKQERAWRRSLEKLRLVGLVNVGLSPFLFMWHRFPDVTWFSFMVTLLALGSLGFIFALNHALQQLTAMLPDETLRHDTRAFTTLNRYLLAALLLGMAAVFGLRRIEPPPQVATLLQIFVDQDNVWFLVLLVLLPVATTMALLWKIKEAIFLSVFGEEA
jgi:hypothetical protein